VKILLLVGAAATFGSIIVEAISLAVPPLTEDQEVGDNPLGIVIGLIILLTAVLETLIHLTTIVFFSIWLYRAANNVQRFNPSHRAEYSPGWAVGSFFVPFVNLIIPYRAVKEVWQNSGLPDETLLAAPSPPATFPVWWLFWLLASFAGNISMRLSFNDNVAENVSTTVSIVAGALSIIAAILAYLVVDAIDKRQEETTAKLNLKQFPAPPSPAELQMSH
jgi:uncharacterized protein DUF4328